MLQIRHHSQGTNECDQGWWPGSPQLGAPGSAFGWPNPGITDAHAREGLGFFHAQRTPSVSPLRPIAFSHFQLLPPRTALPVRLHVRSLLNRTRIDAEEVYLRVYGYVVMPEHVHLLVSEPETQTLAEAMHFLKLSFIKRLRNRFATIQQGSFWQARGYDRNIRSAKEFDVKLDCIHNNPVKRGLVKRLEDWK